MNCYPPEFIYAEKLETVIYRGSQNSRMKDFHDRYSLTNANILNRYELIQAARIVFKHRKTPLNLPIRFDEAELLLLQKYWKDYLPTAKVQLPNTIAEIIHNVNNFIKMDDDFYL